MLAIIIKDKTCENEISTHYFLYILSRLSGIKILNLKNSIFDLDINISGLKNFIFKSDEEA